MSRPYRRSSKPAQPTNTPDATVEVPAPPTKRATNGRQKPSADSQRAMAMLYEMMGRSQLVQRLGGLQYNGNRDIYKVAGYVPQEQVLFSHYWALYTRGDIAGRIIDMPAKTSWRTPPQVVEADDETAETDFTETLQQMAKRLRLWHYCSRVDRLSGIGRYAVMMFGVRGHDDQAVKKELTSVNGPDDIVYLSVYNEANANIAEWVTDAGNERFGLPLLYKLITSNDKQTFKQSSELTVHFSRTIHVAEDTLEDEVYGMPRLQRALNRLYDLEKVSASTGEAYWQMVGRILQAKIDPNVEIDKDQFKDLDEKLGEMVHDLRRQFFGQGVELSWLGSDTPNVTEVADFYFSIIAGAAGIPKRILFGNEMGHLASTTDQDNWLGLINERQEQFAEPNILRAFIDRMIAIGALPAPECGEYKVVWPSLYEAPETDKAQASLYRAQAAAALTPVGGNPRELVEVDEEGRVNLVPRDPDPPSDNPTPSIIPPGLDMTGAGLELGDPQAQDPPAPPDPSAALNPGDAPDDNPTPSGDTPGA